MLRIELARVAEARVTATQDLVEKALVSLDRAQNVRNAFRDSEYGALKKMLAGLMAKKRAAL